MNDIAHLMRQANPVPDSDASLSDDEFAALLLFTNARSGDMNVEELTRQVEPEEKKRYSGWIVAAVAAAIVMLIGVAALLVSPAGDQAPVAPTPTTTPTTVPPVVEQESQPSPTTSLAPAPAAEAAPAVSDAHAAAIDAYAAAWNAGDEEALRSLFAEEIVLEDSLFGDLADADQIVAWTEGRRAMQVSMTIDDCLPASDGVRCETEFDGVVPIAMNYVPWRDTYTFIFDDGKISKIRVVCIICWDGDADLQLTEWVETLDSEAAALLSYGYNLVSTEERGAAWLEWAEKWQEAGRP